MTSYKITRLYLVTLFILVCGLMLIFAPEWVLFARIYIIAALLFLIYRFTAWFHAHNFNKISFGLSKKPYTVMVPIKDEDPRLFLRCIRSIICQEGEKEIIVGDDGCRVPIEILLKLEKDIYEHVTILRVEESIGKKNMQEWMLLRAKHDIVVNVDSDIVLGNTKTIRRLIAPFDDERYGILSGNVKIMRPDKSILNRIQSFMYYCANQIGRKNFGSLGMNPIASGELLALRRDYFMPLLKEYVTKKFLGKSIRFGEDRLMTNLLIRQGRKLGYVEEAIAFSRPQRSFTQYLKQQIRWRRSGIRESLFMLSFTKNKHLYWITFVHLVLPILFTMLMAIVLIFDILTLNAMHFLVVLSVLLLSSIIADLPALLEEPRRSIDLVFFSFFNMLLLLPLWAYALFTLDNAQQRTR